MGAGGRLLLLRVAYGGVFTPNRFLLGFLFGLPAGLLEEIGWTGFAYPHLAAALAGLRVVITWAATNTRSLLIAQLIHISSTGSLVMLGPPGITPAQEALWYAGYAVALWTFAGALLVSMSRGAGPTP